MSRRLFASIGSLRYDRFADFQYFNFHQEVESDLGLLCPLAAGLVRRIDDNLLDELVLDGFFMSAMENGILLEAFHMLYTQKAFHPSSRSMSAWNTALACYWRVAVRQQNRNLPIYWTGQKGRQPCGESEQPHPCVYEPQAHSAGKIFYPAESIFQYREIPSQ